MSENQTEAVEAAVDGDLWVELPDSTETWRFRGELLAEVSTKTSRTIRWTTMQLFKIVAGQYQGQYMVSITGHTVVYHAVDDACNSGIPTTLADLPDGDLEPCRLCMKNESIIRLVENPDTPDPDHLQETLQVSMEEEWYHVARCVDPQTVVVELKKRRGKQVIDEMSRPAVRLLQLAAQQDAAFDSRNMVNEL